MMDTAESILTKNKGIGPGFNMMRHVLSLVILGYFVSRVRYNLKSTEAVVSLNPFV